MKKLLVEKVATIKEIKSVVADTAMNKSTKIKVLFEGGMDVKEIAAALGIRYNFAYNVLQNHIIMNDIEVDKASRGPSKKDEIVKLLMEGKSIIEVCKETKTLYNYVWKIKNETMPKEVKTEVIENA